VVLCYSLTDLEHLWIRLMEPGPGRCGTLKAIPDGPSSRDLAIAVVCMAEIRF